MKPAAFAYHRPASLDETFALLERYGPEGRILAGGQSLVPLLNMRLATPAAVIDINRLPGLDEIRGTPEGLAVGALVRQETLVRSPLVREHAPLLALAMPHVAHLAIRTRGTVGGSVALGDPAAELPACLVALEASVRVRRAGGHTRAIPAAEFFVGVYTTALEPGELLVEVLVPAAEPGWRDGFGELARRHGDYALAGLAARCRVGRGVLEDARLVYFGVGPTPQRARRCEDALRGRLLGADALAAGVEALTRDLDPPSDVHASAALRRRLARVLLRRTLAPLAEA
jgi:carbon-monoxide dehydrogenase medium subunit